MSGQCLWIKMNKIINYKHFKPSSFLAKKIKSNNSCFRLITNKHILPIFYEWMLRVFFLFIGYSFNSYLEISLSCAHTNFKVSNIQYLFWTAENIE